MKPSGRNPATHDVASLKQMSSLERKTCDMAQLKNSFDAASKDGTLRVASVSERVVELFEGDAGLAERWLSEPNRALEWKTPNEMLSSQSGIDEVLRLIKQLQHGVYR
ncbi:antitoxin Xre/MbcA/ParS toxin-binding domain-containing protein [Pectobacterium sp. CHL-2024]|uniref:antitoxin Xre/MbcA/ParS toxin-binding domain-containing protein n=1 Tax=Pectobacterium sp. CHL-2024 TaxID=3377079 RepID=UPI00382B65F5